MPALALALALQAPDLAARLGTAVDRLAPAEATAEVCVAEVPSGRVLYERDAEHPLAPASNMKLWTAAAALALLGADFEFHTMFYRSGPDLVAVADGDPNLSGRFHDGDPTALFRQVARALRERGVAEIPGDLVLADPLFDAATRHPDWASYDPWEWYVAPVAGFSLNDNCIDLTVRPGPVGQPAVVELRPDTAHVRVVNRATTVAARPAERERLVWNRARDANVFTLSRGIGADEGPQRWSIAVEDPEGYFATVLREVLAAEGIPIRGGVRVVHGPPPECRGPPDAVLSSDLPTTLQIMARRSQNFYAEMVLRRIGAAMENEGSWTAGARAIQGFAQTVGAQGTTIVDGSGLSRQNRSTARDLVRLLVHMAPEETFRDALAVAGQDDGTLRDRLTRAPAAGNVFAKTGTLRDIRALSGYARTRSGGWYAFSVLVQGRGAGDGNRLADRVAEILAGEP